MTENAIKSDLVHFIFRWMHLTKGSPIHDWAILLKWQFLKEALELTEHVVRSKKENPEGPLLWDKFRDIQMFLGL